MRVIKRITVVDVLIAMAIVMILSAIILPHFAQAYTRLNALQRAHATSSATTAR